jgi:signal transduction histidine kinase
MMAKEGMSFVDTFCPKGEAIIFQHAVKEADWQLLILVEREEIYQTVKTMSQVGRKIGFLALLVLSIACILFYFILSRRSRAFAASLTRPIRELTKATGKIGTEEVLPLFEPTEIEEIDQLAENFHLMSIELESRTKDLIESRLRERMQEKEAELAFTAGLFESASSYLHNIGNALARMDGYMHDVNYQIKAMEQFPKIFSSILDSLSKNLPEQGEDPETKELLKRFEDFLENKLRKELKTSMARMDEIRNHMAQSIKMQLDAFHNTMDKQVNLVQQFNVTSVIQYLLEDFKPSLDKRKISLVADLEPELILQNQKHPLIHGITNLIKNAIEAIEMAGNIGEGRLSVTLKSLSDSPTRIQLTVVDNGIGIAPEDIGSLFASGFTSKLGGHGLGLRSFNHFLKGNNGSISAKSSGRNCGSTFIVEIGDE